jgi:hypothetical protein
MAKLAFDGEIAMEDRDFVVEPEVEETWDPHPVLRRATRDEVNRRKSDRDQQRR